MKIIDAQELDEIDLPIEGILRLDGSFNIYPEVRKYFDIDYKPKEEKLRLVAGGKIGVIPLNNEVSINIKPKFPISNLVHVISRSGEELNSLDFFTRQYSKLAQSSANLFLFFVKSLNKELQNLSNEGVLKTYSQKTDNLSSPKGRINFAKTMRSNWSKNNHTRVVVDYFEFSIDNPLNRLIKFTLWFCLQNLSKYHTDEKALTGSLMNFYDALNTVPVDMQRKYIDSVNKIITDNKVPQLRHYYINIAKLCLLITQDKSVSLNESGEDVSLMSFSLDMASVFENYILNVLRNDENLLGEDIVVLDGNAEGKQPLFNDRSSPPAKPDYIINKKNETVVLIDAKYKKGTKESDRYQIIAHSLSYGANIAILLCPKSTSGRTGLHFFGTIGKTYQIKIFEYFFDLGSNTIEEEEYLFLLEVKKLLASN